MTALEHPVHVGRGDHRPAGLSRRQQSLVATMAVKGARSVGQPLDRSVRAAAEARYGRDFSAVRLHDDPTANRAARMLNARAATIGTDILFGHGNLQPASAGGRRLLAHELHHVATTPRSGILTMQLDAISDVEDKLSYGLLDWAVTDTEAMDALAILSTVNDAQLAAAAPRLKGKYVSRLIDNLPDAAKAGPAYQRVITALGATAVAPQAKDLLSYGLFDWAITDSEVTKVFQTMVTLSAPEQEKFLVDLDRTGHLARLVSNSTPAHHALYIRPWIASLPAGKLSAVQRRLLRIIVSETGSDGITTLLNASAQRFGIPVGGTTSAGLVASAWVPSKLRQTYLALDLLPESHVAGNAAFDRLGAFTQGARPDGTILLGRYNSGSDQLSINMAGNDDPSGTVLHETGHSVDHALGWSTSAEPAKPARGGWKQYKADFTTAADDMITDSAGAINGLVAAQRTAVRSEIATAMTNRSSTGMVARVQALPWFTPLAQPAKDAIVADPVFPAVTVGLAMPWFQPNGGNQRLGTAPDHIYEESYPSAWNRYEFQARTRILSDYQFRNPGEWFAEAYALYYTPDPRGKGRKLQDKDPDTKTYFDASVDTLAVSRP